MHPLLLAIRENPSDYLPEPSLNAFRHFLVGYTFRSGVEDRPLNLGFDGHEFQRWLLAHFQMPSGRAIADTTIVNSFFFSEQAAFKEYFALLDEFLRSSSQAISPPTPQIEKMSFLETLRKIRKQPALYLGHATFLGCCSYLMGDEHAWLDIGLSLDEERSVFRGFKEWIESEKNRSSCRRSWFKVIQFWSGGIDCGGDYSGGFYLFYKWLDEFSQVIGRDGLFHA